MRLLALSILMIALLAGCGARHAAPGSRTVRDSAGVEIVTLGAPDTIGHQWRIATDSPVVLVGGSGDSSGVFGRWAPRSALLLDDGRIIAALDDAPHLAVFDQHGRLVTRFGPQGEGPGEFRREPTVYRYGDSIVAVLERGGRARIVVFGPDLALARERLVALDGGGSNAPSTIGLTSQGGVVFEHQNVPQLKGAFRSREAMLVAGPRDSSAREVVTFAAEERIDNFYIAFGKEPAFAVSNGALFTGANDGFLVQQYDSDGRLRRSLRVDMPPTTVTDAMRTNWIADQYVDTTAETGRLAKLIVAGMRFSPVLRSYEKIYPGADGGVWIERAKLRDSGPHRFWVFDPSGHFLAATSLPADVTPLQVRSDQMLVRGYNADKEPLLALYRIVR